MKLHLESWEEVKNKKSMLVAKKKSSTYDQKIGTVQPFFS